MTVTDGNQIQYDPICGNPPGFVSYTGTAGVPGSGILTFVSSPPYSPASFCVSAGQGSSNFDSGVDSITISGAAGSQSVLLAHSFQIGVPEIAVTSVTFFTNPFNCFGDPCTFDIAVNSISGFNLPATVFLTGPGSFISGSGPVLSPLPAELSSADCGPESAGKVVTPGGSTVCTIINTAQGGFSGSRDVEVFATFGPGSAAIHNFQVFGLDSCRSNSGCGAVLQSDAEQSFGKTALGSGLPSLTISPSAIQFSPLLPREGDKVRIRARVENQGDGDAVNVAVALVVNKRTVATEYVDISANSSEAVELEWEASFDLRLSVAISVDPEGRIPQEGNLLRIAAVPNLIVEPSLSALPLQGRSLVVVPNGECADSVS